MHKIDSKKIDYEKLALDSALNKLSDTWFLVCTKEGDDPGCVFRKVQFTIYNNDLKLIFWGHGQVPQGPYSLKEHYNGILELAVYGWCVASYTSM